MENLNPNNASNDSARLQTEDITENAGSLRNYAEDPSLSPEQKETLSTIARDLDLLCQATEDDDKSMRFYTGPYGRIISPFKRFSSFHAYPGGSKRSPRKLTGPAPKRTKLFHGDNNDDSTSNSDESPKVQKEKVIQVLHKVDEVEASCEESSEEDKWEIVEDEINTDIDNKLEDKSSKFSLSAMNVKSIIHKIVTNESVVEMVRKAVREEIEENESKFEPKMTRSKLKEFEAKGHLPVNWGLSPRKKRESPNFLEMELPEDEEDDEDFNPDKLVQESDEDSESVHSSYISDLGSPMPSSSVSLPTTPTISYASTSQTSTTPSNTDNENSSQSFLSPMGPPLQTNVLKSNCKPSCLGQKFKDAMEKDALTQEQEEEELIALRTRSKFSLNNCSILELEANFVAPDITPDMYDTSCDDYDWREFLAGFSIPEEEAVKYSRVDVDDPENDPEYDYIGDSNTIEVDQEDFRDDRAVKVSKKEVNELLDDILNCENESSSLDEQYKITIKTQSEKIVFDSNKRKQKVYQQSLISEIGEYERRQIDDQLRKHVQQLTQSFVMTQNGIEEHRGFGETAKSLLIELDSFGRKAMAECGESVFAACNLGPALSLVNDDSWQKIPEPTGHEKEKLAAISFKYDFQPLPAFSFQQMYAMWISPVFMFPELLPHGGFFKLADIKKDRSRVKFLESEDNLLAMGIAQFHHLKKEAKDYIQRFMLPCKSRKQIEIRIKNLKASAAKDNAVKFYTTYGMLPKFPQQAPYFNPSMMKAPKECGCDWHELPVWCKFFCIEGVSSLNESVRDQQQRRMVVKKRRKLKQTACFSVSEPEINVMGTSPFLPISAPATPNSITDSSMLDSSESSPELSPMKTKRQRRQSRKKLNLSKVTDAGNSLLSSFVPLPISAGNSTQSQNNPVTICVLNNSKVGLGTTQVSTLPVVSDTPTVIVINKNSAIDTSATLQNYNQSIDTTTSPLSLNLISQSADFESDAGEIDNLTFEDICRPILESELGTALPDDMSTVNKKYSSLTQNSNNLTSNTSENTADKSSVQTWTDAVSSSVHDLQSNEITSTVAKELQNETAIKGQMSSTLFHDTATSPIPNTTVLISVSSMSDVTTVADSALTNVDGIVSQCGTNGSLSVSDNGVNSATKISVQYPNSCEKTPNSKHGISDVSSSEESPKSALDVVASLATYFLSPVPNSGNMTEQQRLETTPTKYRYQTIAPKPSPVNEPSTVNFHRSPRKYVRSKVKLSPRKRQLQQQAQTILPKGFVVSTYDTSPAKKAASVLVDKAKQVANQSPGLRKILPRPPNSHKSPEVLRLTKKGLSRKRSGKSGSMDDGHDNKVLTPDKNCQIEDIADDISEPVNSVCAVEDDDRCGDTESDYTQSEDGNETQGTDCEDIDTQGTDDGEITHGTDGDSQDSQEEDDITITDNLTKSTAVRYAPSKDYLYSRARHVKKDRNRDMTLTLLEPDIVESDPQRDLRDTLFAQAYIHKVKKTLKDNMEKLEAFLKIMCNFIKEGESPIKLYGELKELFSDHPDLMYDFAGFLQREQAIECGCYKAYQEFHQARTFMRKLELYFSKNPNQLQKVMRTFSRWYKKPGRHDTDLREQIEPMLKGQKILMEEFASFFPNERPSESLMDDFEEVNLDDSGDNLVEDKESSFEEIELLDLEEVYGTKRCTCACHDSGDDTYRKKKKHCYNCGLTVIDGELVYKVNKTTIKKINVKFGPSIKLSSQQGSEQSDEISGPVQDLNQEPVNVSDTEIQVRSRVPVNEDWLQDSDTAEKENIENFSEEIQNESCPDKKTNKGKSSPTKETFLQRISKLPRSKSEKQARLSSIFKDKSAPAVASVENWQEIEKTIEESETDVGNLGTAEDHVEAMDIDSVNEEAENLKTAEDEIVVICEGDSVVANTTRKVDSYSVVEANTAKKADSSEEKLRNMAKSAPVENISKKAEKLNDVSETVVRTKTSIHVSEQSYLIAKTSKPGSSDNKEANDILATAFTSALNTEVSMDSLCFPFSTKDSSPKKKTSLKLDETQSTNKFDSKTSATSPAVPPSSTGKSSLSSAPVGLSTLHVSCDSSFSKVSALPFSSNVNTEHDQQKEIKNNVEESKKKVEMVPPLSVMPDMPSDESRSPPFSPFSPFAQEIQSITSAQSPLSAINSPGICRSLSTSSKVRRITPIPVKDSDASVESPLAFQTVVENSPVLPELHCANSPVDKVVCSNDNVVGSGVTVTASSTSPTDTQTLHGKNITEYTGTDHGSTLQKCENMSQKSSGSNSSNSNNVEYSSSQTSVRSDTGLTISRPDIHSDNANVGFPKSSKTDMAPGGILSEESLFRCLSKPPQFTDTLNTVSGLTNILNALDDHSQFPKHDADINEFKTGLNVQTSGGHMENKDSASDKTSHDPEVNETHNSEKQAVTVGNTGISELGRNEGTDGNNSLPINNQADIVLSNRHEVMLPSKDVGKTKVHDFPPRNDGSGDEMNSLNGNHENTGNIEKTKQGVKTSVDKTKNKKSKMSRRELRRSLQGKDLEKVNDSVNDIVDSSSVDILKHEYTELSPADSGSAVMQEHEITDNIEGNVSNNCSMDNSLSTAHFVNPRTGLDKTVIEECDIVDVKTEPDRGLDELEYSGTSDVQSVSDASSKGRKKSKHKQMNRSDKEKDKKKKKRKKVESGEDTKHSKSKKKKNKKCEVDWTNTTSEQEALDAENMSEITQVNTRSAVENSQSSMKATTEGTPRDSPSLLHDDDLEVEPEWSKETDKTILETCKVHGIKDKTFSRIAKNIGNVTAKQVRKRFSTLYQMIFGVPMDIANQ